MRKITGGFLLLIIMVAFGNLTLESEYQCVWNCARILKKKKREENITVPIT